MAHNTWNGVPVPDAGDGILSSLEAAFSAAGVIQPAASVAAARTALTAAETAGTTPTSAHPAFLDVGGVIYRSTGQKTAAGVWSIAPINEPESVEQSYAGGTISRAANSQHALITSTLPVRPYDRTILAWGMVNAAVSGTVGLRLLMRNREGNTARWEQNESQSTQSVFNMDICPAGVDPQVILALSFGGTSASTARISTAADANRLMVIAFPRTMA